MSDRYITFHGNVLCLVKKVKGKEKVLLKKRSSEPLADFEKRCSEYGKSRRS